MITLVIGGPDSGKSYLAEELALSSGCRHRYYIATMKVMDETGAGRVRKHRAMREGKGFVTLEIPVDITSALHEIKEPKESVVLLECVANLVGNMMHSGTATDGSCRAGNAGQKEFSDIILSSVNELANAVCDLIVVTSEYGADPADDEETALYKKMLDMVNSALRNVADKVCDMGEKTETGRERKTN